MNPFKKIGSLFTLAITAAALFATAPAARAQLGFDSFYTTRGFVLTSGGVAAGSLQTNYIDRSALVGVGVMDIIETTNPTSTGQSVWWLVTANNPTNNSWVLITNYALINGTTTYYITNLYTGTTNMYVANNVLLPGVWTTPTASSASYATPYLAKLGFTNSGSQSFVSNNVWRAAFPILDQQRYVGIIWSNSATSGTNFMSTAILNAPNIGNWY